MERREFLGKGLKVLGLATTGSLSSLLGGCSKREPKEEIPIEYVTLQGVVFSERFVPPRGGWGVSHSDYSFSMDTKQGRKGVQVFDTYYSKPVIYKETIDAMLEPGTKVEVKIEKNKIHQQAYSVTADKIRVLE